MEIRTYFKVKKELFLVTYKLINYNLDFMINEPINKLVYYLQI
jgi:hypothetical protein